MIAAFDRITIDPAVCSGKPCIRGMRFPVHQILDLVAAGNTHEWSDIDIAAFVQEADSWGIFARAKQMARVQKEAGDDIEVHFFSADQFPNPEPASFADYIVRTGVRLEAPAPAPLSGAKQ